MNAVLHGGLTSEKWGAMPLERRLLNVASELSRAAGAAGQKDSPSARRSLERALELVDLTVETVQGSSPPFFLREILRLREALAGFYAEPSKPDDELKVCLKGLLDLYPATHNLHLEV